MTDYILYVMSDRQVSEKKPIYVFECKINLSGSFLLRAGFEPWIPVREASALTRIAKGCSLLRQSLERLFDVRRARFTHSPYWHTSVTLLYKAGYCK